MHLRRVLPTATLLAVLLASPSRAAAATAELEAWWPWLAAAGAALVGLVSLGLLLLVRRRRADRDEGESPLPPLIIPAGLVDGSAPRPPSNIPTARPLSAVAAPLSAGTPAVAAPARDAPSAPGAGFDVVRGAGLQPIHLGVPPATGEVITLGRTAAPTGRHIRVDARTVSRVHAALHSIDGDWYLENRSTTNPVLLNGEPLPATSGEPVLLEDGDTVEMGEVALRFRAS